MRPDYARSAISTNDEMSSISVGMLMKRSNPFAWTILETRCKALERHFSTARMAAEPYSAQC